MSTGWHQLPRENAHADGDGEEEEEEEEEKQSHAAYDEEDDSHSGSSGTGEEQDESVGDPSESRHDEHRINIGDRGESFWDDDDDAETAQRTFPPPPTGDDHSIIDVLADEMRQLEIPSYLDAFEVVIPDVELVVGAVPLEEVQQRERDIEEAKIRHRQLEVELFRQRETRLADRERELRDELKRTAERKHQELLQHKRQFAEMMQLRTRRLGYVFQQAESHLKTVLRRQQARVSEVFGRLEHSQVPAERRKYRVEWDQIPVTVKVRAKLLRAVKDKLPRGQYALLTTLYDRLGGHALHWTAWDPEDTKTKTKNEVQRKRRRQRPSSSALRTEDHTSDDATAASEREDRPNVTPPFHHKGRFYHTDLKINQDVYVVCPPQSQLRPGNVLVFELFLLETSGPLARRRARWGGPQIHDQIVAWGAMPLMTPEFAYVEGKFKIPLLRGEMDATMDKYRDIEDMYTQDLSAWLCNLYLHVTPMKQEMERLIFGRGEGAVGETDEQDRYDVEIDQRNAVYRLANGSAVEEGGGDQLRIRRKSHVGPIHELPPLKAKPGGSAATASTVGASSSTTMLLEDTETDAVKGRLPTKQKGGLLGFWTASSTRKNKSNRVHAGSAVAPQREEDDATELASETVTTKSPHVDKPLTLDTTGGNVCSSTVTSPRRGRSNRHMPSASPHGGPTHGGDDDDDDDDEDDDAGPLDTENYRFSVNSAFSRESASHIRFHTSRKLRYLRHELFVDMGLTRRDLHKMECWLLLLLFAFALWLRVYVHYVAQWLFLKAQRVAVFYFRPQWTTCVVKYTWRSVATHTEIGVVLAGVLGNWALFAFLAAAAAVSQAFVGELPAFGSRFLVCVGVATLLDPFLVLALDLVHHQYDCAARADCVASLSSAACKCVEGDAFKLYTRFLYTEGSGLAGVGITVIVYAALTCLSLVAFYMYLLHVHMNGRMLDVYRRIHAQESELFVPHDCELPLHELRAICDEATRWKGARGMQRKVFVHEYVLQDPLDAAFEEKSTHVALYTVGLDEGERELYRHFLKSPDGAIIELFGQVGAGRRDGAWQRDAAPGAVASLALLHNILQDHPRASVVPSLVAESAGAESASVVEGI